MDYQYTVYMQIRGKPLVTISDNGYAIKGYDQHGQSQEYLKAMVVLKVLYDG